MAGRSASDRYDAALDRAASLTAEALDLIDAYSGPPQAAVHLELALTELREWKQRTPRSAQDT